MDSIKKVSNWYTFQYLHISFVKYEPSKIIKISALFYSSTMSYTDILIDFNLNFINCSDILWLFIQFLF